MHVVVCGAGYAGLTLTRLLEEQLSADVELTLVNESPDHLVQHELHRVVRRPRVANQITISLPQVTERARVRVATVGAIDREERTIHTTTGQLSYDVLANCLGGQTAFYGLETVREHAVPLKRLHDAFDIRTRAQRVLDRSDGTFVVAGAGLAGVQVAGELAEMARDHDGGVTVILLEQLGSVAPGFDDGFQSAIADALRSLDVEIRTGVTVTDADESSLTLESGRSIAHDLFVWTGGIRGPDATSGDRPTVEGDLAVDARTFALGDAVQVIDASGEPVPASAQAAVRQARTAATNIERTIEALADGTDETDLETFSFDSPGWLVSIGDSAVAQVGSRVVTGAPARAMKAAVGGGYLAAIGANRQAAALTVQEVS